MNAVVGVLGGLNLLVQIRALWNQTKQRAVKKARRPSLPRNRATPEVVC